MNILFLIGRILFAGFFIFNGINHFMHLKMMSGYSKSKGVPMPSVAVAFTGLLLLIGGFSILLGVHVRIGMTALFVFLIPVTLLMHNFWTVKDPQARMNEMINFMKNMALLGAVLMFHAIPKPWPFHLPM
jgi:uncharacterized membrane protein YphA (DoxX/SURF4 family)